MKTKHFQLTHFFLFSLLAFNLNSANAEATAEASALATLRITDISNLTNPGDLTDLSITGTSADITDIFEDLLEEEGFGNNGGETSSITLSGNSINMEVDSLLFQLASAESNTSLGSDTSALVLTEGFIDLINDSLTDTFEIAFSFDYSISVLATVTDLFLEDALALAEVILFDDVFDVDINEFLTADSLSGSESDFISESLSFILTLAPESSNELFLQVDVATVTITNDVPEPSVFILLTLGLCLLSWQQKQTFMTPNQIHS